MSAVVTLQPAGISPDLTSSNQFVLWRRDGSKKRPLDFDCQPCNANDQRIWMGWPEAIGAYHTRSPAPDGIGMAVKGTGLAIIDLDDAVRPDGSLESDAAELVRRFDSATELSPSGTGLHIAVYADLPQNRRLPGHIDVLGASGYATLTGHRHGTQTTIRDGTATLRRLLDMHPAPRTITGRAERLIVPPRAACEAVLARAMPNARFRKLHAGDWSEYPSRSEADAAYMMHLARNGGDLGVLVELLRHSGLRRAKLNRADYVIRTARFVLLTRNETRGQIWRGASIPRPIDADSQAHLDRLPEKARHITPTLDALARHVAERMATGETADGEGFWTVSAAMLASDGRSRMTAWRHLWQAASLGCFALAKGKEYRTWTENGRSRSGLVAVSRVRLRSGSDYPSILRGFTEGIGETVYVVTPNP